MDNNISIRAAQEAELEQFFALRLEALNDTPTAFGQSVQGHLDSKDTFFKRFVEQRDSKMGMMFGAWDGDTLLGMAGVVRNDRDKTKHRGFIWGVYVSPNGRRRGAARRMMDAAIEYLNSFDDVEDVNLAVTAGNDGAFELYQSMGFHHYATDPRFYKIDNIYYDLLWMIKRL